MKIQIWSDIACPFCYIGKHHLTTAIEQLTNSDDIEIIYRSFELDSGAPKRASENIYQQLSRKYGMSVDDAKANTQRIASQGQQISLNFHFDTLLPVNTLDAHRLTYLAAESGLAAEMNERLFQAFFTESLNIADRQTLINLAKDVGLNTTTVEAMLDSERFLDTVRTDEQTARQLEISSVPFFIFDDKYAVSGAQPVQVFKETIEKIRQESLPQESDKESTEQAPSCNNDTCTF